MMHGRLDLDPRIFLNTAVARDTRGHPWKLVKPRAASRIRRNAFSVRVVNDWNSLPPTVVNADTLNQSPVHGSCCRADCCCLLLIKRADQSASSSGGKGMWGGRRCMTSYFCCLLLSLLTRKSVSPTAGGETGARGDSD